MFENGCEFSSNPAVCTALDEGVFTRGMHGGVEHAVDLAHAFADGLKERVALPVRVRACQRVSPTNKSQFPLLLCRVSVFRFWPH
jgi:hypothetical protein